MNNNRVSLHHKRRKNKINLWFFIGLAILFFIILLLLITSNKKVDVEQEREVEEEVHLVDETEEVEEPEVSQESVTIEEVESEDPNVLKAYIGNWAPLGTEQVGPHTTTFTNGSRDRIEIKEAVVQVTELDPDDMVEWRVENGGDQKVIATVSDSNESEIYRVYLSWVDEQGWQVTKVETLEKNDKK